MVCHVCKLYIVLSIEMEHWILMRWTWGNLGLKRNVMHSAFFFFHVHQSKYRRCVLGIQIIWDVYSSDVWIRIQIRIRIRIQSFLGSIWMDSDSAGFGFKVAGFSFQTSLLAHSSSISISNVSISRHRQKCASGPSLYSGVLHDEGLGHIHTVINIWWYNSKRSESFQNYRK